MSTQAPMQLLETVLENGQPINWDTTLIVFWNKRFRNGRVAGLEERTAAGPRTVKVRGNVENYSREDKPPKETANVPDMVHLDSPDTGRTRFLTWAERHRLPELWDYAVRTGQTGAAAGEQSPFLPPGKTKGDVIDEAEWTRGGDKGTGQTDTKGPGSQGSQFQPKGQGPDNGVSDPGEPIRGNTFGGPDSQFPGGRPKSNEELADVAPKDGRVSKQEKATFEEANPGETVKKGPVGQ